MTIFRVFFSSRFFNEFFNVFDNHLNDSQNTPFFFVKFLGYLDNCLAQTKKNAIFLNSHNWPDSDVKFHIIYMLCIFLV